MKTEKETAFVWRHQEREIQDAGQGAIQEAQDWGIAGHGRPGFHGSQPKGHIFLGAERDHLMDQLHSFIHSTNHY